jgi:transposase-like protein
VRRIIYTTNAMESLHSQVRKSLRNKGHFPSDEAATKLIRSPGRRAILAGAINSQA